MTLIAIRHGETLWNQEGRKIGQLDSPLSALGIRQTEAVADRLEKLELAAIYCSDLGRAHKTAEAIAIRRGHEVVIDKGLREWNLGIFQGLTTAETKARFPKERSDFKRIGSEYVIPNGESAKARSERGFRVLTTIAERHSDSLVVVVTHGFILKGFFESVLRIRPRRRRRFKIDNASYSTFDYTNGKWSLETWNDTSHLEPGV